MHDARTTYPRCTLHWPSDGSVGSSWPLWPGGQEQVGMDKIPNMLISMVCAIYIQIQKKTVKSWFKNWPLLYDSWDSFGLHQKWSVRKWRALPFGMQQKNAVVHTRRATCLPSLILSKPPVTQAINDCTGSRSNINNITHLTEKEKSHFKIELSKDESLCTQQTCWILSLLKVHGVRSVFHVHFVTLRHTRLRNGCATIFAFFVNKITTKDIFKHIYNSHNYRYL